MSSQDSNLCKILIQKEKKFFLSLQENYASSLKCELTELLEEKELLKQNCVKPNIIRGGFLKNKKIICCLKFKRSWTWTERFMNPVCTLHSQRMELTRRINYLITLRDNRVGHEPNWTDGKEIFKKIV